MRVPTMPSKLSAPQLWLWIRRDDRTWTFIRVMSRLMYKRERKRRVGKIGEEPGRRETSLPLITLHKNNTRYCAAPTLNNPGTRPQTMLGEKNKRTKQNEVSHFPPLWSTVWLRNSVLLWEMLLLKRTRVCTCVFVHITMFIVCGCVLFFFCCCFFSSVNFFFLLQRCLYVTEEEQRLN